MAIPVDSSSSISIFNRIQNTLDDYFSLNNSSWETTALKVISYMTLVIPALMLAMKVFLSFIASCFELNHEVAVLSLTALPEDLLDIINTSPAFDEYRIGKGTPYEGTTLTTPLVRPSNLLYETILGPNCTTMPGNGQLFSFTVPFQRVRDTIQQFADQERVLQVHARDRRQEFVRGRGVDDLTNLYGNGTFRISGQELQATLDSQRIYCAPLLPVPFYRGLKVAMAQDRIVVLPNVKVHQMRGNSGAFIQQVRNNPQNFDFQNREHFEQILGLTMYQLGSLVVKTEDFRVLIDENGQIRERNPGERDAIRVINACGIRNIDQTERTPIPNETIISEMFSTAFESAQSGYLVMPSVGMGVSWANPGIGTRVFLPGLAFYWPAFFEAVAKMHVPLEWIFVNPGESSIRSTFVQCFNDALAKYAGDPHALANLQKIVNLSDKKTDIIHFANRLRKAYPNRVISLFNASNPDVTLGYNVGGSVNTIGYCSTTDENLTAEGTNGILFEEITGIHEHPERFLQARLI